MDYYDAILGLIPLALLVVTAVLIGGGVSTAVAVPLAASVSAGLVGHAMFVRTPSDPVDALDAMLPKP